MLVQYKCPNCGSDMSFDSVSGTLACPSCERQDHIETFPEENKIREFSNEDVNEYHCENCGAEIITDADTTATSCDFCGAPVVLADRLSGKLAPHEVIPFSINKEQAQEAFKAWCKNGRFSPKGFMTANRIKNITGMYVPFWLYDMNTRAKVRAQATKVRNYTSGDYIYTETKHYELMRDIDLYYAQVPVDASEKMDDALMDKLEPYHYKDLKDFKMPYLAGYVAEKYNYDANELLPRIQDKITPYINNYIRSTMSGYTTVNHTGEQIDTKQKKSIYVLMPVWMVYYDFNHTVHTFAMNGQTGKVVGKPPISKGKVAGWFLSMAGGILAAFKLFTFIAGGPLW